MAAGAADRLRVGDRRAGHVGRDDEDDAGGSAVGGQLGARYGKRLPPWALRTLLVIVGVVAIVNLLT